MAVAQNTSAMNWNDIELRVFKAAGTTDGSLSSLFALPDGALQQLELRVSGSGYALARDPSAGRIRWRVTAAPVSR
jgi:hypothetical protein